VGPTLPLCNYYFHCFCMFLSEMQTKEY
jgi:hypothetical protein